MPTVANVRTALLHLVELAAASEGRGLKVNGTRSPGVDHSVLAEVTNILLKHLKKQRLVQRDSQLKMIVDRLTASTGRFYRDENQTSHDLEQDVRDSVRLLGIEPTQEDLDALLRDDRGLDPMSPDDDSIRARGGPAEAAKHGLASAVGLSARTIAESKAHGGSPLRAAFGRVVSRKGVRDYLAELSATLASDEAPPISLASLGAVDDVTGSALDRTFQSLLHLQLTEGWFAYAVCFDDSVGPELRVIRNRFDAQVEERCLAITLVAMAFARELDGDLRESCLRYLKQLPPAIRRVALLLTRAFELSDVHCVGEVLQCLKVQVQADFFEKNRERWQLAAAQLGAQ